MDNKSFIGRVPSDLGSFFQYVGETRQWSFATIIREVVKTSPLYDEFLKKVGVS